MEISVRWSGTVLGSLAILCVVAWAGDAWKAPASAKNLKNPVPAAEGARTGQAVYQENCVICHGQSGKGDGEAAAALRPKPAPLASRTVQAQTDGELFWKITEGHEAMPSWKSLAEQDRWSLVRYLRSLTKKP